VVQEEDLSIPIGGSGDSLKEGVYQQQEGDEEQYANPMRAVKYRTGPQVHGSSLSISSKKCRPRGVWQQDVGPRWDCVKCMMDAILLIPRKKLANSAGAKDRRRGWAESETAIVSGVLAGRGKSS
jgi:hypothetical protein